MRFSKTKKKKKNKRRKKKEEEEDEELYNYLKCKASSHPPSKLSSLGALSKTLQLPELSGP